MLEEEIGRLFEEENRPWISRNPINRDREGAEERLMADYFNDHCRYPLSVFRKRYRMRRKLFLKIVKGISTYEADPLPDHFNYFRVRPDCTGRMSLSVIMKCTAAIRQLAYGNTPDAFDEYLQMAKRTSRESLQFFCDAIIQIYSRDYLRRPTSHDIACLYEAHEARHHIPGMIGSLDCTHFDWRNCPIELRGQYKRGDHR